MAKPEYGSQYQKARKNLLGRPCHLCDRPGSDSVDHVPALHEHEHRERSGCCRLLPAHLLCNIRASGGWRAARGKSPVVAPPVLEPEHEGFAVGHRIWRKAPWLKPLLKVPADAVWPRYMTGPHPRAVGTLGAGVL